MISQLVTCSCRFAMADSRLLAVLVRLWPLFFSPFPVKSMNVLAKSVLCGVALGPLLLPGARVAAAACKVSKEFQGEAPSVIVQDALHEKFQHPLKRVDCRDDGLCYQRWGKDCGV